MKSKKVLGIVLAVAMAVMCVVPVKAAATSWAFDNSAYSYGIINRTDSAGVYSSWLAGSNAGAVTKAYFSVGNDNNQTDVRSKTKLTYPDDTYRGISFKAKGNSSTIYLYDGNNIKTYATANK